MRKDFYLKNIEIAKKIILKNQLENGAFSETKKETRNARLQEAVLTLAWLTKNKKGQYIKEIELGINYWISLQNANGSFPELSQESFSATAFSTSAVSQALFLAKEKIKPELIEKTKKAVQKASKYLLINDSNGRTNQDAVCLQALENSKWLIKIDKKEILKKKEIVLKNKTESGFFKEDTGIDLGYSSLTASILCSLDLKKETKKFAESLKYFIFPNGVISANLSRTNGWIILHFLESIKNLVPEAEEIANQYINADKKGLLSARHFLDFRHAMTDSYRLCFAFDECKKETKCKIKLPHDEKNWFKIFPEQILIVKKTRHTSIFYLTNKFTQTIWFKNGLISNQTNNLKGNTIFNKKYVIQDLKKINWTFSKNKLIVNGICKRNLSNEKIHKKIMHKLLGEKEVSFSKEFEFTENKIKIKINGINGVEHLPCFGKIKINGFSKEKENQVFNQLFFNRKDFFVLRKQFNNELTYELSD